MDVKHLKEQLLTERDRLLGLVEGLHSGGMREPLRESIQELSVADNHPGDIGSETFEREKDAGLADMARLNLDRVDEALKKIEEGTYGMCSRCGSPIAEERLNVLPQAKFCMPCQNSLETEEAKDRDPSLSRERATRKEENDESMMYDSEDAWQDVARYGTGSTPSDFSGTRRVEEAYVDSTEPRGVVEDVEGLAYEGGDVENNRKSKEEDI